MAQQSLGFSPIEESFPGLPSPVQPPGPFLNNGTYTGARVESCVEMVPSLRNFSERLVMDGYHPATSALVAAGSYRPGNHTPDLPLARGCAPAGPDQIGAQGKAVAPGDTARPLNHHVPVDQPRRVLGQACGHAIPLGAPGCGRG